MNYKKILLLKEGVEIFSKYGFDNLVIKDLEKQAGIRKGTFFEYFDTTEKFAKDCYIFVVAKLLKSNTEYISKLDKELPFEEISRKVWFNTIGWWLNEKESFHFFEKFKCCKYYLENSEFIIEASNPYIEFAEYGQKKGHLKDMPTDFLYELVLIQILNTVRYIEKCPKLISDKAFLALSFDALWDSIKKKD
jgi:AcrR family transcriptional regulator